MSLIEEVCRSKGLYWKERDMSMPTLKPQIFGWLLVCMRFRAKREGSRNVDLVLLRIDRIGAVPEHG